jgi:hypothetical protein
MLCSARRLVPLLLLIFATSLNAEEWKWPDGKLAFQQPASARFTKQESVPAPLLARWMASDGVTNVAVLQTANPGNVPLDQHGLEIGTLKNLNGGSLVSSTSTAVSNIPAYTIVTSAAISGGTIYIAQSVIALDEKVYNVMVVSTTDPLQDAELGPLLKSLRVLNASAQAPSTGAFGARAKDPNAVSVRIAAYGLWLLLAAFAVWFLRKAFKRPAQAPPPPPAE